MKRTSSAVAILVLLAHIAVAQSPVVRVRLEPAKGILVGQPVRLVVSVFVPNYFTGNPDFPEFEIENAIVVLPQDRPENSNTQIGGVSYAGITETYVIYPQQAGDFHLPSAQIEVPYAVAPPKSTTARVALPKVSFHADVPAAAKNLDYFLPTTSLTIHQTWSSPLKDLRVGASVERTVTVTATKMQAMLIPPLPLDAPEGIRIYSEEPVVDDQKTARGDFVYGRRTQTAKYLIQKEGEYKLPPIELKWWNLSTNRLVTATLPAVHFTAASNPDSIAELPPEPIPTAAIPIQKASLWKRYKSEFILGAFCCIAGIVFAWISWRIFPSVYRDLRARRERRSHSEAAYFRHLRRACIRSDATQSYIWLLKWLAVASSGTSLQQNLERGDDLKLSSAVNDLTAVLFAKNPSGGRWSGKELATILKKHRRTHTVALSRERWSGDLNPSPGLSTNAFTRSYRFRERWE
jgi:hypothetical protein